MSEKLGDGQAEQSAPKELREAKPNSLVGLSLSLCVRDILEGKVKEEEVKEIIAGTKADTPESIEKVIREYQETSWQEKPEEGAAIAKRLFKAGKISQPRAKGRGEHNISKGHWLNADNAEEEYEKRVI